MKYRVYTNDCGPGLYSMYCGIEASNEQQAKRIAQNRTAGFVNIGGRKVKVIVLLESQAHEFFQGTPRGLKPRRS